LTEATLTAPISRASLATVEEAGEEADHASAWVELVRGGVLEAGQCAICERRDGPFEEHHVAGRLNSDLTIQACKERCHPRLSERQNGWDPRWQLADNSPELKETLLLRGLSDLCEERARHFGPEYHRLAKRLRAVYALRARQTI
jgi:hypothetical protein